MLQRIFIDNFRQLVNFEITLERINLFLGYNGTGKSTVFDVLKKIQQFARGDSANTLFHINDLTRWQKSLIQYFELVIGGNGGIYHYELAIEFDKVKRTAQVHHERLSFDGKKLFEFDQSEEQGQFYGDDQSAKEWVMPFVSFQSVLPIVSRIQQNNTHVQWFVKQLSRFIVTQINPGIMLKSSDKEASQLSATADNFVSWYRYISQNQKAVFSITTALQEIWDGFEYFRFVEAGESRWLVLSFFMQDGSSIDYAFDELSDGQRALIVLYALLHFAASENCILCIDEPENYLALSEIQPWLLSLYDFCNDNKLQSLIISHHPEFINHLAASGGYWFDCQQNGPVRVSRIGSNGDVGISMSELVARGWIHA